MNWLPQTDDGTLSPDSKMAELCRRFRLATIEPKARPQQVGGTVRELYTAGFVGVSEEVMRWPTNPWPEIRRNVEMSHFSRFSNFYLHHFFTHVMKQILLLQGVQNGEVDGLVDGAINELCSIKIHAFFNLCISLVPLDEIVR